MEGVREKKASVPSARLRDLTNLALPFRHRSERRQTTRALQPVLDQIGGLGSVERHEVGSVP
jgi:hypothetical protein